MRNPSIGARVRLALLLILLPSAWYQLRMITIIAPAGVTVNHSAVDSEVDTKIALSHIVHDSSNTTTFTTLQRENSPRSSHRLFYSQLRPDRPGSAIQDMLMAHAYAYQNNLDYGGACSEKESKINPHLKEIQSLIIGLGLDTIIQVACPQNTTNGVRIPVVHRRFFASGNMAVFSKDWLEFIHSKVKYPSPVANTQKQAVVHIRRGDVEPCNDNEQRYLPNAYYERVIHDYIPLDYTIIIHSEAQTVEGWESFQQLNKTRTIIWKLDHPNLLQTWQDMMTANIFVMSKSSFSVVPALLNRHGRIIYTQFWYEPLPHWTRSTIPYDDFDNANLKSKYCTIIDGRKEGEITVRGD